MDLEELLQKERELTARAQEVQHELQGETGALDLRCYKQRLAELGLQAEWDALQAEVWAHPDHLKTESKKLIPFAAQRLKG